MKVIFNLGKDVNFCLYFPHSWLSLGEIGYKNIN
jgi:hypothetical protein